MATHIFSSKNKFVLSKILPYSKYINLTQTRNILNCDGGFHVFGGGVGRHGAFIEIVVYFLICSVLKSKNKQLTYL